MGRGKCATDAPEQKKRPHALTTKPLSRLTVPQGERHGGTWKILVRQAILRGTRWRLVAHDNRRACELWHAGIRLALAMRQCGHYDLVTTTRKASSNLRRHSFLVFYT